MQFEWTHDIFEFIHWTANKHENLTINNLKVDIFLSSAIEVFKQKWKLTPILNKRRFHHLFLVLFRTNRNIEFNMWYRFQSTNLIHEITEKTEFAWDIEFFVRFSQIAHVFYSIVFECWCFEFVVFNQISSRVL